MVLVTTRYWVGFWVRGVVLASLLVGAGFLTDRLAPDSMVWRTGALAVGITLIALWAEREKAYRQKHVAGGGH